jgi:hypothetical protein
MEPGLKPKPTTLTKKTQKLTHKNADASAKKKILMGSECVVSRCGRVAVCPFGHSSLKRSDGLFSRCKSSLKQPQISYPPKPLRGCVCRIARAGPLRPLVRQAALSNRYARGLLSNFEDGIYFVFALQRGVVTQGACAPPSVWGTLCMQDLSHRTC